jgi:quinol---cytochrome c reductase iron-sulfur subunit
MMQEPGWNAGPVGALLGAAVVALAATVAYWAGADTQLFGGLAAVSLLLAGIGLVWWAKWAMPDDEESEEREELASSAEERAEFSATFVRGQQAISRRRLLVGSVVAVAGAYAALGLSLLRSLAPNPDPILRHTSWQKGSRLVTASGEPLLASEVRAGGVVTVFPEAHIGEADAQTLVIRVPADVLKLPAGHEGWAYDGIVAYSKVCTHAGCPVGLYQEEEHLLLCPCHQSTFDVRRGAQPTSGPAARPLPQLPIEVDADGYLVAQSDYQTPIGPGFWNMPEEG